MNHARSIAKALLATTLLLGPSIRIASSESGATTGTQPVPDSSPNQCEQYPDQVICYANHNRTQKQNQYWYNCYATLCDAVADGAYQCKKKLRFTCEPQ